MNKRLRQEMKTSKYTYDHFLRAVQECNNSKTLFISKYRRLYDYSQRVGWYKSYTWHNPVDSKQNQHVVYCYKDIESKSIYIGLTKNQTKRHLSHKTCGPVFNHFKEKQFPHPEILMANLTAIEAKRQEGIFVNEFRKAGWKILNKAKTGEKSSSLGGSNEVLTYEVCYTIAQKYKSKSEFQKNDVSAYRKSLEKGWINSWFSNLTRLKWTREKCYEVAKEYKSKSEFRIKNQSAYNSALHNGWLNDYFWFKTRRRQSKWNEESCLKAAKSCRTRSEFAKKYSSAYKKALKNGWVNNYNWLEYSSILLKKRAKWTYETCRNLALNYTSRWQFGKENSGAYHACLRNNWLDSFTWFKIVRKR
jgi:hypothetical protein